MQVDVASIKGGPIPVAPDSLSRIQATPETSRFLKDSIFQAKVEKSLKIDAIDFTEYDIVFLAGGWGAAYDLTYSTVLATKIDLRAVILRVQSGLVQHCRQRQDENAHVGTACGRQPFFLPVPV
jgi:putative intracellular protease/amidase